MISPSPLLAVPLVTIGFGFIVWATEPAYERPGCVSTEPQVIRYLPMPEPAPLVQSPPLGWPVAERAISIPDEPKAEPAAAVEQPVEEAEPRRHRHHWRRRWWR
jgi:hypothetical protein